MIEVDGKLTMASLAAAIHGPYLFLKIKASIKLVTFTI